jgi:uncharacterized protein YbjT (DUF2867 family)
VAELRRGPIAITGASGQVGTLLRERLAERPNELRPLNQGDDWAAGIQGAEVVVHLAGTLQPKGGSTYESANVGTTEEVAAAARGSGVERIVFLSYPGADPASGNAYLSAKGQAEGVLDECGIPVTILRCVHIYGPPDRPGPMAGSLLRDGNRPVVVPGSGRQRIAPLYLGDVAAAVLSATLEPDPPAGTFELAGPDEMSMDEFVRGLNGGEVRIRHLRTPIARIAAHLVPALTPALVDLLVSDNVATTDPTQVAARFGFSPHRFDEVWKPDATR